MSPALRSAAKARAARLLAAAVVAVPASGLAEGIRREPIRIAYEGTPGCPDAGTFAARVIARSSHLRLAERGEPARTFAVTLVEGTPARGELNVVDGENVESARNVTAETCADVAEAMSLIVALAANPKKVGPVPVPLAKPSKRTSPPRRHRPRRRPRPPDPHPSSLPEAVVPVEPRIEAGAVRVDAPGLLDPKGGLAGWFAAGATVRAQHRVLDSLFTDAELGFLVRATDDRYVVPPRSTAYTVPPVGLCVGVGVGSLFP